MDIVSLRRTNLRAAIDAAIASGKFSSDADFANHYDINPSQISQMVKGHGSFGEKAARNLEKKIGWEPGVLDLSPSTDNLKKPQNMNFVPPVDLTYIDNPRQTPVLSWVQAGDFSYVLSSDLSSAVDWIPYDPRAGKNGFALIVKGASMEPDFKPDEFIYINPTYQIDELNTGALVVMACEGDSEATFKKLISEDGNYYLQPLNPNWKPQLIPLDHTCRLVGKVVGKYTRY
ncbi:S24 family peptidase [Acinetobacter soli]|uniref:LexA family protein n=1 Tax=Acinetobacter soli TaxID=487316 RepID=UPI00287E38F9|nr:S24 family peptidase [Acinetobacter soli]MDS7693873.1 S24 family peptidase [Acinetobacter soli]